MAIEDKFYIETSVSRYDLRDTLARSVSSFKIGTELKSVAFLASLATNIAVRDNRIEDRLRFDTGVRATCSVLFVDRKRYYTHPCPAYEFQSETARGVFALLAAYPEADAFMQVLDADIPVLLRRDGQLILDERAMQPDGYWTAYEGTRSKFINLPYTIAPLGPWELIPNT